MHFAGVRSIANNTAMLTAAQAVGIGARVVYVVLVARFLGPELYALLAYTQSWYLAFLPLALFGLGPTIVYEISRDRANAPGIAAGSLFIRIAMTVVAGLACIVLSRSVAPDPRAPALIAVLVIALSGRALSSWAQHLFAACGINRHTLRQEVLFRVLELLLAGTVLGLGGGVLALAWTQALVWLAQAVRALVIVRREVAPLRIAWRPAEWWPLALLALPFLVTVLAVEWRANGPLILFRNVNDDAILFGQFALAMQAVFIAGTLPQSLWTAAQPVLTRSALRGDGKDLVYASAVQRLAFLLGTVAGLCGLALGAPLFSLVFGPGFATAGHLAGLSLWCLIPLLAGSGFPPVALARGQVRLTMVTSIAGAVVMTASLPFLARGFGAAGAIAAAAAGFALPVVVVWALAVGRGWADPVATLVRPLAAAAAALLTWLLLAPFSPWLALPAALLALAGATILLGVVTRQERALLLTVWRDRKPLAEPG